MCDRLNLKYPIASPNIKKSFQCQMLRPDPQPPKYFRWIAKEYGCEFLNASEIVAPGDVDGIHLEVNEHQKLGNAVAVVAKKVLG